jgi:hypothetical protein
MSDSNTSEIIELDEDDLFELENEINEALIEEVGTELMNECLQIVDQTSVNEESKIID